ncbi:S41 family peptidase [Lichenicoccus roseus]|uniref:Tricorn protease homolog n=1 Tax=Lichenicoccus roseus TaxID=2683649 RepID=A0A5R9IYJ6_9PROT|nr:S41 family peptidase [Lichenicoccus roseus]TLU70545.1 hypothetical protein FE263_21465 [Lichenicoccus roseus]
MPIPFVRLGLLACATLLQLVAMGGASAAVDPRTALIRFPNAGSNGIAFAARGHLWLVDRSGGTARRLTGGNGFEFAPHFSPDGRWIAFTGDRGGQQDVYVMPATGGEARRLTWLPRTSGGGAFNQGRAGGLVFGWTPDGRNIVFAARKFGWNGVTRPFTVPLAGGEPEPLPVDEGAFPSFAPDGHRFAFTPSFFDFQAWKRYEGGEAPFIDILDPRTGTLDRITDSKGSSREPMWARDRVYFVSDRDVHRRANIWVFDIRTRQTRQVTRFTDYDVDIPSLGGGAITFGQAGRLWRLDLPSERLQQVPVLVPDDGALTGARTVPVGDHIRAEDDDYDVDYRLSPDGTRVVFSARGDIMVVPTGSGSVHDLTGTPGVQEDNPVWSPNGRRIAYTTDADGEKRLAVRPVDGGPEIQLTRFNSGFLFEPVWSPDGKWLAVHDGAHRLWLVPADGSGTVRQVAYNRFHYMHETDEHDAAFSPDGRWLAFSTSRTTRLRALHLYDVTRGIDTVVSQPENSDYRPAFSADGNTLFFVSDRHEITVRSDRETDAEQIKSGGLYAAALAADAQAPFEPDASGEPRPRPGAFGATWRSGMPDLRVDPTGLMDRAVPVPVPPDHMTQLDATADALVYETQPPDTLAGGLPGEQNAVHWFDLRRGQDELVVAGPDSYALSSNGSHLLYQENGHWIVADAEAGHPHAATLDTAAMTAPSDPRAEWREMFEAAWRLERDQFVNPNMNGNDWRAVHDDYAKLLPLLGSREDLNYLLGQMVGEMGSSHLAVGGGDDRQTVATAPTPQLGVDYELDPACGRYRLARVTRGDPTRAEARAPLAWPGLDVRAGTILVAIDGHDLRAPNSPDAMLFGKREPVTLTLANTPDGPRRDVTVMPVANEDEARKRDWIASNRALVDRLSDGRIGYLYMQDMQDVGMQDFVRQFYPQLDKQALLVDDRWNHGGNTDQIVLERLRRVLSSMQTLRDRVPQTQPDQILPGPKAMLINRYSGSDGEVIAYHFRAYGLGKLIGTRGWGGVRGLRTDWELLDGGTVRVPEITFYDLNSHWIVENHGVDPDVLVEERPDESRSGHDTQLEAGVQTLLAELLNGRGVTFPPSPAALPAYPPSGEVPPVYMSGAGVVAP